MAALFGALFFGAGLLPVLLVLSGPGRQAAGRTWARAVLRSAGIRLEVRGAPPRRRALLVANHVSWLDIVAILAVTPARMLAKHEVRRWPLIGSLAALGGTIFVDRTRPRTLPVTVARVTDALRADSVVAVFPEGTTWCGRPRASTECGGGGRFRPAMFQAAIDAAAAVVPVHLGYRVVPPGRDRSIAPESTGTPAAHATRGAGTAAAFLAEESLLTSVRRVLALRGLVVTLTAVDEPWFAGPVHRRRLAVAAQSAVRAHAGDAAPPTGPGSTPPNGPGTPPGGAAGPAGPGAPVRSGTLELAA